jgi:hypothetical protein
MRVAWSWLGCCWPTSIKVRWIYAQPFRVVTRVDGRVRSHVLDWLLVTVAETTRLVNVKPARRSSSSAS